MECRHGNFWIGLGIGLKAVEAGAEIADKVADEADKVAGKAKDKWGK